MTFTTQAVGRVRALLEAQRKALLGGHIGRLDAIARDMEAALQRMARSDLKPEDIAPLKAQAAQNARLIAAARDGVAAGRAILARSHGKPLATYDRQGAKVAPPTREGRMLSRR